MINFRLSGRVYPTAWTVTVPAFLVGWLMDDGIRSAKATIAVEASVASALCEVEKYDHDRDYDWIFRRAVAAAKAAVNMASFGTGMGTVLVFDKIQFDGGEELVLVSEQTKLARLCTAFSVSGKRHDGETPDASFLAVFPLIMNEDNIRMAISDLVDSIVRRDDTLVNCARAMDGIRNTLAPDQSPDKGWSIVQTTLRVNKDYLKFITEQSKRHRHGDRRASTPGSIVDEVKERSWVIMNRLLEFRKRGNQVLPEQEFPELH